MARKNNLATNDESFDRDDIPTHSEKVNPNQAYWVYKRIGDYKKTYTETRYFFDGQDWVDFLLSLSAAGFGPETPAYFMGAEIDIANRTLAIAGHFRCQKVMDKFGEFLKQRWPTLQIKTIDPMPPLKKTHAQAGMDCLRFYIGGHLASDFWGIAKTTEQMQRLTSSTPKPQLTVRGGENERLTSRLPKPMQMSMGEAD